MLGACLAHGAGQEQNIDDSLFRVGAFKLPSGITLVLGRVWSARGVWALFEIRVQLDLYCFD